MGRAYRPLGGLEVVGDGHDLFDADGLGTIQDLFDACRVRGSAGVQVGVGVDQAGQRFRAGGFSRLALTATP